MRAFATYGDFARYLERQGELHRVTVEVDPHLEITEIATRALREERPALWFEKVRGSRFPLVINGFSDLIIQLFGAERGGHARSAVGMAGLPFGTPVEIEAEVEIRTGALKLRPRSFFLAGPASRLGEGANL